MKPYLHKVQYYETDRMGITHHSNYVRWLEEARVAFLEDIGWSYATLEQNGVISPVVSVECKYLKSTTFDDIISISVTVKEFKGVKLILDYQLINTKTNEIVCQAQSAHCFTTKDGKLLRLTNSHPQFAQCLKDRCTNQKFI